MKLRTWELPWVELVEINVCDYGYRKRNRVCFSLEVMNDEFFICWVEAKSRWEIWVLRVRS
jgi:hypothetical protein